MLNFIKAEFFRIRKRNYNVGLYTFGFALCAFLLFIFSTGVRREDRDLNMLFFVIGQIFSIAAILVPLIVNLTALEPYASGAINNNLAIGQSRMKIYIANALVSFFYILVYMIIMLSILIIGGYFIAPAVENSFHDLMKNFLIGFAFILPCVFFYISLVLFMQILTRHRSSAIAISYVGMAVFEPILLVIIQKFDLSPMAIFAAPMRITRSIADMMGSYGLDFLKARTYTSTFNIYSMLAIICAWIVATWLGIYFVGRKREF